MGRKVTQDDIDRWVELRNRGYTFQKIGEETGWSPETVRAHVSGQGAGEGEAESAARYFKFFHDGGTKEQAVIEFGESYEIVEKFWQQWRTSNEDEFRRELEKKDAENRELREANFILREANERLRRRLAEYEKRLSSFGTFREMVLLRAMVDMIG